MARKPDFDRAKVLGRAMSAFWEHGYEGTSLTHLLATTGLSKSSLYAAFGDKHKIFLESYDLYRKQQAANLYTTLDSRPAPEGIRTFFEHIITGGADQLQRFGCMSTNQAAELGAQDGDVRARVAEDYQLLENAFTAHLLNGQKNGTVPQTANVSAAASALVTAFSGFQLTVRADMDRTRLRRSLDYLLSPLTISSEHSVAAANSKEA
ncbi:TetR/AcrR family transcriptional regulator [Rothia uropygialis]|uniref:TetR/AcrR family transcriptional regulator n=1 Tax=Kocuria sp. 36 TaxID=1415402 RepID=UPI0013EAD2E5|nr:TetR/AcrR family transcriptional regulator [Kocuria sp. 36]